MQSNAKIKANSNNNNTQTLETHIKHEQLKDLGFDRIRFTGVTLKTMWRA